MKKILWKIWWLLRQWNSLAPKWTAMKLVATKVSVPKLQHRKVLFPIY